MAAEGGGDGGGLRLRGAVAAALSVRGAPRGGTDAGSAGGDALACRDGECECLVRGYGLAPVHRICGPACADAWAGDIREPLSRAGGGGAGAGAGGAGAVHRAEQIGSLGAPRRDALRLRAALFGGAAGGAAEAVWVHAGTELFSAVRPAFGDAVLAAVGEFLGRGGAEDALARRGCADGRGVEAGLCPDAGRPARGGEEAAPGAGGGGQGCPGAGAEPGGGGESRGEPRPARAQRRVRSPGPWCRRGTARTVRRCSR